MTDRNGTTLWCHAPVALISFGLLLHTRRRCKGVGEADCRSSKLTVGHAPRQCIGSTR